MTHELLNLSYIEAQLRQNPHYTAGFHGLPYAGKTKDDKLAYALGQREAGTNILRGI